MGKQYPKVCQVCGKHFIGRSGRAKFCEDCRLIAYAKNESVHKHLKYIQKSEERFKKYKEGVTFVCKICGRTYRVHERTHRVMCNSCLSTNAYGKGLIRQRKDIEEELVED